LVWKIARWNLSQDGDLLDFNSNFYLLDLGFLGVERKSKLYNMYHIGIVVGKTQKPNKFGLAAQNCDL
jgi:hypothetical protein